MILLDDVTFCENLKGVCELITTAHFIVLKVKSNKSYFIILWQILFFNVPMYTIPKIFYAKIMKEKP